MNWRSHEPRMIRKDSEFGSIVIDFPASTTLKMPSVFRIIPTAQKYDWGKRGSKSKVAQLAVASKLPDFRLDENVPYAEVIWPLTSTLAGTE
jgi:hypothetical protein